MGRTKELDTELRGLLIELWREGEITKNAFLKIGTIHDKMIGLIK